MVTVATRLVLVWFASTVLITIPLRPLFPSLGSMLSHEADDHARHVSPAWKNTSAPKPIAEGISPAPSDTRYTPPTSSAKQPKRQRHNSARGKAFSLIVTSYTPDTDKPKRRPQ